MFIFLYHYLIVIFFLINHLNAYDVNTFEQLLFKRLGIRNHIRKRRDISSNYLNMTQQTDMLNLYSDLTSNKSRNNNYNIIRSFENQFVPCIKCSTIQEFKLRTKRFKLSQQLTLRDNFKFNLNYFSEQYKQERLVKSDLELRFDLKNLILSSYGQLYSNNYNELKIDLFLNGKQVNLVNFNSTLIGIKSKLMKLQIHKIRVNKLINECFISKKEFKLNLILKVKFKSTINKLAKLNTRFNQISDLLVKNPIVVTYSNDMISQQLNKPIMASNSYSNQCGKKPFTISFKELGWDNVIIEPKYLSSYYCSGNCDLPLDDNLQPTNYAILISLASRIKRFNYLPNTCCKPAKLAPKMFMFVDDNDKIVIKKIDNIIVESCSCQ